MDNIEITTTRTVEVTPQMLEDLLVTALEGGTGYWACMDLDNVTEPTGELYKQWEIQGDDSWTPYYIHIPMSEGGAVPIFDAETVGIEDEEPDKLGELSMINLLKGLRLWAKEFPGDFQEFLDEDYDANHADVFMQLAVMGEVVYG